MVITQLPGHPPGPEFGMHFPTISPMVLPCPKGPKNDENKPYAGGGDGGGVTDPDMKIYK